MSRVGGAAKRLWPRHVRTRLAIVYAVIFLIAGGCLLTLTYGLLASHLPRSTGIVAKGAATRPADICMANAKIHGGSAAAFRRCKQEFRTLVQASASQQRDATLTTMLDVSLIGLGLTTLTAGCLGWFLAGRTLAPTEAAMRSRQRFIDNAAHELRTPLTAMRTAVEVTMTKPERSVEQWDAAGRRVLSSIDRATATVDALLTLSTTEAGGLPIERVDLATAVEDALQDTGERIEELHLDVKANLTPAPTMGDPVLLQQLVRNLIENAARHNTEHGSIEIATTVEDGHSSLRVANSGPGVAADLIPILFEPFARGRPRISATDGVGLGLSIARAITTAHGGSITAVPRPQGGLELTVQLVSCS